MRVGNEEIANRYWLSDERRKCRLCGEEQETLEHVIECSEETRRNWRELLHEDGRGIDWMEKVKKLRKIKEDDLI